MFFNIKSEVFRNSVNIALNYFSIKTFFFFFYLCLSFGMISGLHKLNILWNMSIIWTFLCRDWLFIVQCWVLLKASWTTEIWILKKKKKNDEDVLSELIRRNSNTYTKNMKVIQMCQSTVLPRPLIYEHVHFPRGVISNRPVRYQQAYS